MQCYDSCYSAVQCYAASLYSAELQVYCTALCNSSSSSCCNNTSNRDNPGFTRIGHGDPGPQPQVNNRFRRGSLLTTPTCPKRVLYSSSIHLRRGTHLPATTMLLGDSQLLQISRSSPSHLSRHSIFRKLRTGGLQYSKNSHH